MESVIPGLVPNVEIPKEGLPIGEAAAACGLSIDTLRYYEREGLTLTAADRAPSGQRRYFEQDLGWLRCHLHRHGGGLRSLRERKTRRTRHRRSP
jgi:DNA-binding transcriptional MerR regulator